jgi:Tfp pilus assembly protein PilV
VRASWFGLTLVEVLVAVVVLAVGVLALVGTSAQMSRMIGRGRQATVAAMLAAGRIERLRGVARSTSPPCTGAEWRSDSAVEAGVSQSWRVLDPAGVARRLQLVVRYRTPTGLATDTIVTAVLCEAA